MNLDRTIKLEKQFASQVSNVYQNAARFCWNTKFINEAIAAIYDNSEFCLMPRHAKSFVHGVRHHCDELHWKLVAFSYCIDGVRMMTHERRYRKLCPKTVCEKFGDTGAFVYKDNPTELFTQPEN